MAWDAIGPELDILCLRRLEENITVPVTVELTGGFCCGGNIVALLKVHFGDTHDGIRPRLLRLVNFQLRDGHLRCGGGQGSVEFRAKTLPDEEKLPHSHSDWLG